jgi:Domain of unknown function (DUF4136)
VVHGGLGACTSVPVKTDYDHSASFDKYHTSTLDIAASGLGPTNNAVLQQALRSRLAARGLKETSGANASLYIVAAVITQQKLNVLPGGGVAVTRFGAYRTWAMNTEVQQYTEGTLIITLWTPRRRSSFSAASPRQPLAARQQTQMQFRKPSPKSWRNSRGRAQRSQLQTESQTSGRSAQRM